MKKIKYIFLFFSVLIVSASCEKELELKPHQDLDESVVLTTEENVRTVLVGAYTILREDAIYGGNVLRNSELFAADGEINWQGTYNAPREIYNHQIISANNDITDQWLNSYECINACNNVISALSVVNEDDRDIVEGEALFLRSLMYFDLVRFYANTYESGQTNSQLGVPLVLTPTRGIDNENKIGRNTVEEVYSQIITDLQTAATVLPADNGYYATSGAANALLARIYLQQGNYAAARDAANTVIGSGTYSLTATYAEEFNNDDYTTEDIFGTKFTPADGINQMTEFWSTTQYGGRDGDIEILQDHIDLYDPADARLALFWTGNGGLRSGKWNNQYGLVNLIRLAEMYLIRAECNQRLSTSVGDTPLNDFNRTYTRAGFAAHLGPITIDDILLERRLELAHEGFKFHDLKRLQLSSGAFAYDDPKMIFPIPSREIEANPGLSGQQNATY